MTGHQGERTGNWREDIAVYLDRRILIILLLGFSSGLPLALSFSTLTVWMSEAGVSKTAIGLFALAGAPYTFKFLWSPLIDRMPLPPLTSWLGRRRGWGIATQLGLIAALVGLGSSHPGIDPWQTALFALMTTFFSASQDIVIDAYRVEILKRRQFGAGAATVVFGYRMGMLASGIGALYLASFFSWSFTYNVMAVLMLVGILTFLFGPEPEQDDESLSAREERQFARKLTEGDASGEPTLWTRLAIWLHGAVYSPFADFMRRPDWLLILFFILLYKFGDALAGVMSNPFYLELGFTKIDIANFSKLFGLVATIVGGFIGGVLVHRLGIMKTLLWCGLLQMLSNLMFVALAQAGHNLPMLALTIAVENLSGGMGTAAFVAYLSGLCNIAYTATQYALLSSFMSFGRTVLSSSGGWLADTMSWPLFYLLTTAAALPGLILLLWMMRRYPSSEGG